MIKTVSPFIVRTGVICLFSILLSFQLFSQNDPKWDDTRSKNWPVEALKATIPSSADSTDQPVYFYRTSVKGLRPLVVSLHTWSGDFQQKDTVVNLCIQKGYHYIHPNFRGPNNKPEACGSELVIRDIDDAISWAVATMDVDPDNIHVIGTSGGAYATVLSYMKSRHRIRSFSAYAGIYNLVDWYYESVGRKARYAGDIAAATSGRRDELNVAEAKKRSPFFMEGPPVGREHSRLFLYCGIHDGYTGSVPVSQTLTMYNKIVADFNPNAFFSMVPQELILKLTRERMLPDWPARELLLGRKVVYSNQSEGKVFLTVFEGGHEMPAGDVLAHIPSRTILAIGDSNGALEYGWVNQLRMQRKKDVIVNTCRAGNTIGFDNLGNRELNTLRNVDEFLKKTPGKPDDIIILLGTNDCKAIFDNQLKEVPDNLARLIRRIREHTGSGGGKVPRIVIVSPPPYAEDALLAEKYKGGSRRVEFLASAFAKVARENNCIYVDLHGKIKTVYPYLTEDGIHLTKEGQVMIATIINESIK